MGCSADPLHISQTLYPVIVIYILFPLTHPASLCQSPPSRQVFRNMKPVTPGVSIPLNEEPFSLSPPPFYSYCIVCRYETDPVQMPGTSSCRTSRVMRCVREIPVRYANRESEGTFSNKTNWLKYITRASLPT